MNSSIKDLLNSDHSEDVRNQLRTYINSLNKKYKYGKHEIIDPEIIIRLLTYGYIEDDYETYISKKDDSILSYEEQTFLFNVKKDIPNSRDLSLRKDHLDIIKNKIQDYQWNSQGILNNTIIDYILAKESYGTIKSSIVIKIVQAMFSYDCHQSEKFIPKYFIHCKQERINTDQLLYSIGLFFSTERDNKDISVKIINVFFQNIDSVFFLDFLEKNDSHSLPDCMGPIISSFLNRNEVIKNNLFVIKANDINALISTFENKKIKIDLTTEICQILINLDKLSSDIYPASTTNINLILKLLNENTEDIYYLTRCFSIKGLKDKILNHSYMFFHKTLLNFKNVDEDYDVLKTFLETNLKSDHIIQKNNLQDYFSHIISKWENFVLYNHFISFDESLYNKVSDFLNNSNENQKISDQLIEDKDSIKEFIRATIKEKKFNNEILLKKFLPFWKEYIPVILNCYKGYEEEIQSLSIDRNHLLQTYAIQNEKIYFGQIMFILVTEDPDFFENEFPEEEFAKENEFQLMILESNISILNNLKKHFLNKISICPTEEDDVRRYKAYKNAGLLLKNISDYEDHLLEEYIKKYKDIINEVQNIDLCHFEDYKIMEAVNFHDLQSNRNYNIKDPWTKILLKTLKYWLKTLCSFISFNTFDYGNGIQGLSKIEQKDSRIINERTKKYQEIIEKLKTWTKEADQYILPF